MPRPARPQAPGVFHLTQRGVAGDIVCVDEIDYSVFTDLLEKTIRRYRWNRLAHCLMSNHFHIVVEFRELTMARGMQYLTGQYGLRFNERHDRRGHLFQGRYRSTVIGSEEHLAEALRYVALNPVRAGLCGSPEDWPWSSYLPYSTT